MKLFGKLLSLLVVLCIFGYVSSNAGDKKDKVALVHNGHIIVVAPEAVPAHLAHGDVLVTNDIPITINYDPSLGSVDGPTSVPSGESASWLIIPNVGVSFLLTVDGNFETFTSEPYTLTLMDVTSPVIIDVFFFGPG